MIIDCHTHIFNEKIYQGYLKRGGDRVDKILTIHDWDLTDKDEARPPTNDEMIAFAKTKPGMSVIASVDMREDLSGQLRQLDAYFAAGDIVGLKLYPGYQAFYVSEPRIDAFADLCAKYKKPLTIHGGDVYDPNGTARLLFSHPIHVDELAVRHRDCTFVIAHFGFPYFAETANVVSKNPNVYTDISAALTDLPTAEAQALFDQFITDIKRAFAFYPDIRKKVMFGTDYAGEHTYLNQVEPYYRAIDALFADAEKSRALGGLAEELFFRA